MGTLGIVIVLIISVGYNLSMISAKLGNINNTLKEIAKGLKNESDR